MLEALAILSRGDVRSDVHKELDHQLGILERFQSKPGVDGGRLDTLIHNLAASRDELSQIGTSFLQPVKDSEFLNAIKHRSAIPGGTCEFDLPVYSHWLRQPFERRQRDMEAWLGAVRPVCDAVTELLWLIRESSEPKAKVAINGMYQHGMQPTVDLNVKQTYTDYLEWKQSRGRIRVWSLDWEFFSCSLAWERWEVGWF